MNKIYRRLLLLLFLGIIINISTAQQINLVRFNNTISYTAGSGVSVIINPIDTFAIDNQFILELSDLGGTWNNPTVLTTLDEFYIPAINGVLPTGLTPGTYKLRIRSTNPSEITETESFTVVSGNAIGLPKASSAFPSTNNSTYFNCLSCDSLKTIFGSLNRSSLATTTGISLTYKYITICNYSSSFTYSIKMINPLTGAVNNISHSNGVFSIPDGLGIGTYVFEITKSNQIASSTYSIIFIFHGDATSLTNSTTGSICVGEEVIFTVSTNIQGIGRNYYGSKYSIDFGDGTTPLMLTHAQLMNNPTISHIFETVSCGTINGYFTVQEELWNKGYNSICNDYVTHGSPIQMYVNASIAPKVDFILAEKQCVNAPIFVRNTTIEGSFGAGGSCSHESNYGWYYKKPHQSIFTRVTNVNWIDTNDNLTIPSTEVNVPGCWEIFLTANNADGCDLSSDKTDTIKIEALPRPSFTISPTPPICTNTEVSLTNTSNVKNYPCQEHTFLWSVVPDLTTPATPDGYSFTSNTDPSSTNSKITFTHEGNYFVSLTITNSCGSFSTTDTIQISGNPTVEFPLAAYSQCTTNPANYTLNLLLEEIKPIYSTGPFAPVTYLWSISGTGVNPSDYSYVGGTSATSAYPQIQFTAFKTYEIKVRVGGNCSGFSEADFLFTLKEIPVITNTNLTQVICSGSSTNAIPLTSSMSGSTFSWTVQKTPNITTTIPTPGSGNTIPSITIINNSTDIEYVTYSVTPENNGCSGEPKDFIITVSPKTIIATQTITSCSGVDFTVAPTNGNGNIIPLGTTYSWSAPSVTGGITGGAASANQSTISGNLINPTNTNQTATYTVTPFAENCEGDPFTLTVTVEPMPLVNNQVTATCSGVDFTVAPTNGNGNIIPLGTTYSWSAPSVTGGITGGAAAANQSTISGNLINPTNTNQTATYTVTPTAGNCQGDPFTLTVTVEPMPLVNNQVTATCSGVDFTVAPTNGNGNIIPLGTTYSWSAPSVTGGITGGAAATNQSTISGNLINPTNTNQTATYTVTPTAGNCQGDPFTLTVTVEPMPLVNNQVTATCSGVDFTVAPTNGNGNIIPLGTTYSWSAPSVTGGITGGAAATNQSTISGNLINPTNTNQTATYTVTPTAGNCQGDPFTLTVTVEPMPLVNNQVTATCSGVDFTVAPTNGNGNIIPLGTTYSWSAPSVTGGITGGAASANQSTISGNLINPTNTNQTATYTVTPTAGNCQGDPFTLTVTVKPIPGASISGTTSVCQFSSSPVITFTGSNGTSPYIFTYNINGGLSQTITTISGNSIEITIPTNSTEIYTYNLLGVQESSTLSCSSIQNSSAVVTITETPSISTQPLNTQRICQGGTIAPLTVAYSGGTGTPSYQWYSNTTNSNSGGTLIPGAQSDNYTPPAFTTTGTFFFYVTVTLSGSGCGSTTSNTAEVIVVDDPVITSPPLSTQTVCRYTSPGNLSVTASGGEGSFSYQWYSNTINSNTGGALIPDAQSDSYIPPTTSVGTTYYYCLISQSGLGCGVSSPTAKVEVVPAPDFTTQPVSSSVCQAGTPTTLSVTYQNGTGTPSYQWYSNTTNSNSGGTLIPDAQSDNYIPPTTSVGTAYYYCTITFSGGGCSSITSNTAQVTVTELPSISTQPLNTQRICQGGTIAPLTVAYSGGTGTPSYQWYSNTTNSNSGGTLIPGAQSDNYTPPAFTTTGTFFFYVTVTLSGSGCGSTTSNTAEVIVVDDPVITSPPLSTQTVCRYTSPGNLSVTASGGEGSFSYQWYSNTINSNTGGALIPDAQSDSYIPPTTSVGTTYYYCLISQSGLGCGVSSPTAKVEVVPAPDFTTQPVSSSVCQAGTPTTLSVTYQNGTGTPSYQWYSNTTNSNSGGTLIPDAQSDNYIPPTTSVGTAYYYCTITFSGGGCSSITSNTAQVTVKQIPVISDKSTTINNDDTFTIIPDNTNGDIVPIGTTYTWVIQSINPTGSISGASAEPISQPIISQHLVNTSGLTATVVYLVTPTANGCSGANFIVTVNVYPPIKPNAVVTNILCYGENNGSISTNIEGGSAPYIVSWTGPNGYNSNLPSISNLASGVYHLSINDDAGAYFSTDYTITEPNDIIITTDSKKDITCYGADNGQITLSLTGGTGALAYSWTKDGNPFSNSEDLTDLAPGNYVVSVTDANHCGPKSSSYTITEPEEMSISLVNKTDILCYGNATGAIEVDITGGTLIPIVDYLYSWTGPSNFVSAQKNLQSLIAGTYNLTVTDNLGCTATYSVTITQPNDLSISIETTPITCYGADDASIRLNISGGVAPYQAQWDNFLQGVYQENLSAGNYTIVISDANNCSKTLTVNIPEAPVFKVSPVVKQISCYGAKNGSIKLNLVGGQPPVTLVWTDNPNAGVERNNIGPGTYTVTISDASPCYIIRTFTIVEPLPLSLSATISDAIDCDNPNSGAINLLVSGGTGTLQYAWSNGANTEDLSNIPPGNYTVTVTDAYNCTQSAQFSVQRQDPISVSIISQTAFDCPTQEVSQISTAYIVGGFPPYQLTWSRGETAGTFNEIMQTSQSGPVILEVTDALGCTYRHFFIVNVPTYGIIYNITDCNNKIYNFNSITHNELAGNSYLWDFGDGTSSTEKNITHQFAAIGIYTVRLTVSNSSCTTTYNKTILVEAPPLVSIAPDPIFCFGDSILMQAYGAYSYRWSDGSTANTLLIKQVGNYSVEGYSLNGCTTIIPFAATNYPSYNYTINTDKTSISKNNSTIELWSEDIPFSLYYWDFGDDLFSYGNNLNHTYTITRDQYYDINLTVTNPHGCIEHAMTRIWTSVSSIPNTFTPNGDGINDIFMPGWLVQIFNRNGVLLYEGTDGWDGTYKGQSVANDTYFYTVFDYTEKGKKLKQGYITVIR